MNGLEVTAVMVAVFFLRLALPLAITLAFGYGMNRLLDRWQVDA